MFKILIVKLGAIGDAIMASTIVPEARRIHPNAHITWLCGTEIVDLVNTFKGVDDVVSIDNRGLAGGKLDKAKTVLSAWQKLKGERFDLIITAHSDSRYLLLTKFVSANERRSFGGRALIPGRYHATEYARLVSGMDDSIEMEFPFAESNIVATPSDMILLAPGGAKNIMMSSSLRRWNIEYYVALAKMLIDKGFNVGLVGSNGDLWAQEAFYGLNVTSFIGKTTIPELMALIGGAKAVVSHDSGTMHIAYYMGRPLVSIFGATSPNSFTPKNVSYLSAQLPCSPCYDGKNYAACSDNICMQRVTPEMVIERLSQIIDLY
ncbi:MAG: glycosyltransferase family 9 protein [Deferribacteraceae bacterium]|jgi:heptosyltransferase-2|nr:glycosyltransferase family 9 protein [Deferribacteraceae bacterium]